MPNDQKAMPVVAVRLPATLHNRLASRAAEWKTEKSTLIRTALELYLSAPPSALNAKP